MNNNRKKQENENKDVNALMFISREFSWAFYITVFRFSLLLSKQKLFVDGFWVRVNHQKTITFIMFIFFPIPKPRTKGMKIQLIIWEKDLHESASLVGTKIAGASVLKSNFFVVSLHFACARMQKVNSRLFCQWNLIVKVETVLLFLSV